MKIAIGLYPGFFGGRQRSALRCDGGDVRYLVCGEGEAGENVVQDFGPAAVFTALCNRPEART